MANRALTEAFIMNKIQDMTFHAIVSEAYINALPIPQDSITDEIRQNLSVYVKESLDDLGGFNLLDTAIEECRDLGKKAFLKQVKNICTESAKEVTKRILNDKELEKKDLDEVSNGVAMTESEYNKFVKRATSVDSETLSDMIQKKTLDTIKSEKEAHKKDAELRNKLEEALKNDNSEVKNAAESFVKNELHMNENSNHSTLFSKLQEVVYEALLFTIESYTDIPFETMTALTKENTFNKFHSHNKSAQQCFESVCRFNMSKESVATPDGGSPVDTNKVMNDTLLTTTLIYTFFETLNTMNLWTPKLNDIMSFINETLPLNKRVEIDKVAFVNALDSIVATARQNLFRATTPAEIETLKNDLEIVREKCALNKNFATESKMICEKLDQVIESMKNKISSLSNVSPKAVVESAFEAMARNRDTLQFSRVASLIGKKPAVDRIRFKVDYKSDFKNQIAVEGLDAMNRVVASSHIALEQTGPDAIDYVKDAIHSSQLPNTNKKLEIYIAGGRHPKYGFGVMSVE